MNPEQLARYRDAVASDRPGEESKEIVARLEKADITVHGHGGRQLHGGYPADHPRITLLRYKGRPRGSGLRRAGGLTMPGPGTAFVLILRLLGLRLLAPRSRPAVRSPRPYDC